MKITTVTMTGADDSVSIKELFKISKMFPFVEWGILLSKSSRGQSRFPSTLWLADLFVAYGNHNQDKSVKLSAHLCGSYVRQFLMGSDDFIGDIGRPIWRIFKRVQINTHGVKHDYSLPDLRHLIAANKEKQFIFQYDNVNRGIFEGVKDFVNVETLFDLSHGAGVLPEHWPVPIPGTFCGYAGGLSPANIKEQIQLIERGVGGDKIWIDAETHLRSNHDRVFDLDKVREFLINSNYFGNIENE